MATMAVRVRRSARDRPRRDAHGLDLSCINSVRRFGRRWARGGGRDRGSDFDRAIENVSRPMARPRGARSAFRAPVWARSPRSSPAPAPAPRRDTPRTAADCLADHAASTPASRLRRACTLHTSAPLGANLRRAAARLQPAQCAAYAQRGPIPSGSSSPVPLACRLGRYPEPDTSTFQKPDFAFCAYTVCRFARGDFTPTLRAGETARVIVTTRPTWGRLAEKALEPGESSGVAIQTTSVGDFTHRAQRHNHTNVSALGSMMAHGMHRQTGCLLPRSSELAPPHVVRLSTSFGLTRRRRRRTRGR